MLVVLRKNNESIMIGDNIRITVLESSTGKAKIGISADKSIPVHRQEVYDDIKAGNIRPAKAE
jgi:carbon storage regulator